MTARASSLLVAVLVAALGAAAPMSASREVIPNEVPGIDLPVTKEHTYKMSGRVRALLLWIGRDDVGSGVIRWRGMGDDHAYELLIGSDPAKAPAKLNKWGFLAEQIRAGECDVFGVMSKDSEKRLSDVKTDAAGGRPFNTIRGRITQHEAYARLAVLQAPNTLTYRQADTVLKLALSDGSTQTRTIERPDGVRPGFLSSVAEVFRSTTAASARGGAIPPQTVRYIYGDRLYELRLLDAAAVPEFEREGRTFQKVIRGRFETGRQGVRPGYRFELVFGTTGPLAGVPVLISYQPNWWLHVELMIQS
jgi:hypothetical protein